MTRTADIVVVSDDVFSRHYGRIAVVRRPNAEYHTQTTAKLVKRNFYVARTPRSVHVGLVPIVSFSRVEIYAVDCNRVIVPEQTIACEQNVFSVCQAYAVAV